MILYLAITMTISVLIYYYFLDIAESEGATRFVKKYGIFQYYLVSVAIGPIGIPYLIFRIFYNILKNR